MLTEAPPITVLTPTTAAPSSQPRSILTDEDLLFLYDRKELRCLAAADAYFGDRPRYTLSATYMQGYRDRLEDMAKRNIPTGTRTNQPMLCWGEGYQTVAEHF